jgi:ketosteroid isomerase-like protein
MSQHNVEIVRRALEASTSKPPDVATVNVLYHRDHVITSDWGVEGQTFRGARGWAESVAELDAAWDDWRHEVEDVLDAGQDRVVAMVRLKARGKGSGAPVDQPWAIVMTIQEGRITASHTFLDRDEALRAVGLAE